MSRLKQVSDEKPTEKQLTAIVNMSIALALSPKTPTTKQEATDEIGRLKQLFKETRSRFYYIDDDFDEGDPHWGWAYNFSDYPY